MEIKTYKLKNGRLVELREATSGDASELLSFIQKVSSESDFLTFGSNEFDMSEHEEKTYLETQSNSNNRIYLVATIDEKIVAMLNFTGGSRPRTQHNGEFSMVVLKAYWGLGIGSHLVDTLLKWAKSTQIIKKLNLRVRTDNFPAIHLYEKKGFVKEGTLHKEIFIDGNYYDLLWMGLEL
jgi:RimJ/RimL family protein N-acetyltransferase